MITDANEGGDGLEVEGGRRNSITEEEEEEEEERRVT